jgi:hypothetical protein
LPGSKPPQLAVPHSGPGEIFAVESVELDLVVVLPAVQPVEIRDAVHAKQHGFAIEDKLLGSDAACGLDNERISACPVIAIASEEADAVAIAGNDQAIAVLFDFVDPVGMTGDLRPARRNARSKRCCRHNGEIGLRPSECESNKPAIEAGFVPFDKLLDVFRYLPQLKIAAMTNHSSVEPLKLRRQEGG